MPADSLFGNSLTNPQDFTITYELVPGQGAGGKKVDQLLDFASAAKKDGRISALSVTDNAGGHPALAPVAIGTEIKNIGLDPLIHFSLKDKNRNQVESHLFLYQRQQFNYLLVLGGDFPKTSYCGQAKPVYDLDTIQTIELVEHIKAGRYRCAGNTTQASQPFDFQCGCVVSPFKMTEAEQVWQYAKLLKKIRAGASFIITQLGFDLDKYAELITFLKDNNINLPILANVFVPTPAVAKIMAKGGVPGVLLPHELAEKIASESKEQRLVRAASMTAVLRGLGYSGVHLGGSGLSFANVSSLLDRAEGLKNNWQNIWEQAHFPCRGIWSLYRKTAPPEQHALNPGTRPGGKKLSELTHGLLFDSRHASARLFGRLCIYADSSRLSRSFLTVAERIIKDILFSCRMCGDCTLSDSTYLCPQSGCPKKLVNGPCGGSNNSRCEVFPDRRCFYVRVYMRCDRKTTISSLAAKPILQPKNWALEQGSSWINHFRQKGRHCPETDSKPPQA